MSFDVWSFSRCSLEEEFYFACCLVEEYAQLRVLSKKDLDEGMPRFGLRGIEQNRRRSRYY